MNTKLCLGTLCVALIANTLSAGLAITEIMSSASTNLGPTAVAQNSDWWELTNFGTNTVDLAGYKWNDNQGGLLGADPTPFTGLSIGPGESIIFFQSNAPAAMNPAQFREWWGGGLSSNTTLVAFIGNGLSSVADGIRLWGPNAVDDGDVIDSVDFDAAIRGTSFVYNRLTGVFDSFSTNGVDGAFKAVTTDDVASPGKTSGPVPLVISQQPTNTSVNPGDTAIFTVAAKGLPRPVYQWFFGDTLILGARFATLMVTNVTPDQLGSYHVVADNGFQSVTSDSGTLALNAQPEPPAFILSPQNKNAFVAQTVAFATMASGVPQPTYQWYFNGALIDGARNASYTISSVDLTSVGTYTVIAENSLGTATNQATLTVTRRPRLVVTEIMPAQNTNGPVRGHNDWWELSNLDDFVVDLTGYRFDDNSAQLAAAVTFTNQFTIGPGESIIFVENMSAREFRDWWGDANLRTNQQIITYRGAGLSLSSLGDAVNIWNSAALEDFDTIASEVFSTSTNGVSFTWDPDAASFGALSVPGLLGAWASHENGDIGSPGFLRNPPEPRILEFIRQGTDYRLIWTTQPGRNYKLQWNPAFTAEMWTTLTTFTGSGAFATNTVPAQGQRAFYRIVQDP